MSTDTYKVQLTDIFEGPMDLLIFLIKKNEVDIYDIPIAAITDQYLEYLELMKAMNIDIAGEFVVMAATLIQIKSRMLLPVRGSEDEEDDPRLELARPLAIYLQIKSAAEKLIERNILGEKTFVREPVIDEFLKTDDDEIINVDLFELIDAFRRILDHIPGDHFIDLGEERISIKDRITELIAILEKEESVTFDSLFPRDSGKSMIILTFIAILEMAKLGIIRITQHVQTGIIRIFYMKNNPPTPQRGAMGESSEEAHEG